MVFSQEAGWQSLFDGTTLDGWEIKNRSRDNDKRNFWQVNGGVIEIVKDRAVQNGYIWLQSEDEYSDFELKMKVKGISGYNSGIQIRSRYDEEDAGGWMNGPQVEVAPNNVQAIGSLYDQTRGIQDWISPTSSAIPSQRDRVANWKRDDWNDFHIICSGTNIKVYVNGLLITDYDGTGVLDAGPHFDEEVGMRGHIALQIHSMDNSTYSRVQFKDIYVKDLTTSSAYGGTPHTVPGMIQAEHFDLGVNTVAYFDTTEGNAGNSTLREGSDVDLIHSGAGNARLSYVQNGEWWNYTTQFSPGVYDISFRVSRDPSTPVRMELMYEDDSVIGSIESGRTGGWNVYKVYTLRGVEVTRSDIGKFKVKAYGNLNLDAMMVAKTGFQSVVNEQRFEDGQSFVEASLSDDSDGDGILNGIEYLSGSDIWSADRIPSSGLPQFSANQFSFSMQKPLPTDVRVCIETSTTLEGGDWVDSVVKNGDEAWPADVEIEESIDDYKITYERSPDEPKKFYRLVVE